MKHTQEEWEILINEFKASGLSQRKWCKVHNEDRNSLQYWLLRFDYLSMGSDIEFAELVTGGDSYDA